MAGPPWGLLLTFKSLSGSGGKAWRGRGCLLGLAKFKRRCPHYWPNDSEKGWQCPPPGALAEPRLPAAGRYPAHSSPRPRRSGRADPSRGGGVRCCHFCRTRTASGCHPGPTATAAEARPANPHRPRLAPRSGTPALTFPRCSALLAHSP